MNRVGIVSAVRTPIGNFGGAIRTIPAYRLAAQVLNEVINRVNLKSELVDMVVMGQNYQSGEYVNIARMGLLLAGWPVEVPGITLDRRCPSGADAICFGKMLIDSGESQIVVSGGVESMSTAEFYLKGEMRWSVGGTEDSPRGHGSLTSWSTPLYDRILRARVMAQPVSRFGYVTSMMTWAEAAAKEYNVTREDADIWALRSNQRSCAAIKEGRFATEIVPIMVPQSKGDPIAFTQDERPRFDTTIEALAKLKPVIGGVCTAGNSSGENDGASVVILMSEQKINELGLKPLVYVKAFAFAGTDPCLAYKATPAAVRKVLAKTGLTLEDIDLIEIHEAFASQALANLRELGLKEKDYDKINVNGSCVALGHPLGATGARITTTLSYEMNRRNSKYGLLAICGGGGMGVAIILER